MRQHQVLLRADGEFISSHSVQAAIDCGYDFIIANKRLGAVPSAKFKNNYAFFQVVMLAYNIWRYMN